METYKINSPVFLGIFHFFIAIITFAPLFTLMLFILSTVFGIAFAFFEFALYSISVFISLIASIKIANRILRDKIKLNSTPNTIFATSTLFFIIFGLAIISLLSVGIQASASDVGIGLSVLTIASFAYYYLINWL